MAQAAILRPVDDPAHMVLQRVDRVGRRTERHDQQPGRDEADRGDQEAIRAPRPPDTLADRSIGEIETPTPPD